MSHSFQKIGPFRNLLIAGPLHSGKRLIARALGDPFVHIETDYLILALQRAFPKTGVGRAGAAYGDLCGAFLPFLCAYAAELAADRTTRYVLDCHYIRPHDSLTLPGSLRTVFVGYPEISTQEKIRQIRDSGQKHCDTNPMSEEQLEACVSSWIEQSRHFREDCNQLGIPFFDTSRGIEECLTYLKRQAAGTAASTTAGGKHASTPRRAI